MKLEIIFENEQFIAVNKPPGLLSIPDRHREEIPSLQKMLTDAYGRIFTVHRLDKDTSGIILFAKDEETHKYLSRIFEERNVEKIYQGLVYGILPNEKGTIDAPIAENPLHKGTMVVHRKGKSSLTDYEVVNAFKNCSLVQLHIHTGRTHQIRVHMKHIGHPILCDETYGDGKPVLLSALKKRYKLSKNEEEERPILSRLALHSYQLRFTDSKGEKHELTAPHAKDMRALIQQLNKL